MKYCMRSVIEGVIQAIKSAQEISLITMLTFLEQTNPSSRVLSFGNELSPQNKAHWDPLEGRGPKEGLQPPFLQVGPKWLSSARTLLAAGGVGRRFPLGLVVLKQEFFVLPFQSALTVLCDNSPTHGADDEISPSFVSVQMSRLVKHLPHPLSPSSTRGPGWGVALPCAGPGMCWPGSASNRDSPTTPWVQRGSWRCAQHILVTLCASGSRRKILSWQSLGRAFKLSLCLRQILPKNEATSCGQDAVRAVSVFAKWTFNKICARTLLSHVYGLAEELWCSCFSGIASLGHVRWGEICSAVYLYQKF